MADTFQLAQGDRVPVIQRVLRVDGALLDLTGCTVRFQMWDPDAPGTYRIDGAATVVGLATAATVNYPWGATDTTDSGAWLAWWEVTYPSGEKIHVPNGPDFIEVTISPKPV